MANDQTMTLVLIRHGESEWNKKNLFTGWADVDLSEAGRAEAAEGGRALAAEGYDFDLNKSETAAKYGEDQVLIWRRSFDTRPPALEDGDERDAHLLPAYRDVDAADVPMHECLKDNIARTWPYFESEIPPQMKAGKRVLIAAHGNSLRSLVMQFDKLTEEEIVKLNIPTAVPLVYKFDADLNVIEKRYIGDPAVIEAKINKVANQGKAK